MFDTEQGFNPKGSSLIDEQLAVSGITNNIFGIISAAVGIGSAILGANSSRRAAQQSNDAVERQHEYDKEAYKARSEKLVADRQFTIDTIATKERNERRIATYQDAAAARRYNYDMMIRNREQESLNAQFVRSNEIFNEQINLNEQSARNAARNELTALMETRQKLAFDNQELIIESLRNRGAARARGVTGRSAEKVAQSYMAELGRQQAILAETATSAARSTKSAMREIAQDKFSADLAAYAQKMLEPGTLPEPIKPIATPVAEFIYPRELELFDFGPEPVKGAMQDPGAAFAGSLAASVGGIASSAMGAFISR